MAFESFKAIALGFVLTTAATGAVSWALRDETSKPVGITPKPVPTRVEPIRVTPPTPTEIPLGVKLTTGNRYPDPQVTTTAIIAYTVIPRPVKVDENKTAQSTARFNPERLFPTVPTPTSTAVVQESYSSK